MQPTRYHPKEYHESFPVASRLLPEAWRQKVLDFYSFARGIDDICDNPALPREEKRQQLRVIKLALQENTPELLPGWAVPYHRLLLDQVLAPLPGEQLWQACWQDTEKNRYLTFEEVLSYAKLSAAPVGRAVLEIAKEMEVERAASDALCIALQLLDHLQDARSDYLLRQRVYLPQHWLEEAGISEKVLMKKETGPKLRKVFDLWLDETDKLLAYARHLPRSLNNRRLRGEVRAILACAQALSRKLRREDPMSRKVQLTGWERFTAIFCGILGLK